MPEKGRCFRIRLDVLAFLVAAASLAWQVFDAVQKQREHVSGEVVLTRQPVPGKIDISFTVRNPGSRPIFVESFEIRGYADKNASSWRTIEWPQAPKQNVIAPGQSLTMTITVKSLDELKNFFQQQSYFCFYFQSQAGSFVRLWLEPELKQRAYAALAFEQPSIILTYRVL